MYRARPWPARHHDRLHCTCGRSDRTSLAAFRSRPGSNTLQARLPLAPSVPHCSNVPGITRRGEQPIRVSHIIRFTTDHHARERGRVGERLPSCTRKTPFDTKPAATAAQRHVRSRETQCSRGEQNTASRSSRLRVLTTNIYYDTQHGLRAAKRIHACSHQYRTDHTKTINSGEKEEIKLPSGDQNVLQQTLNEDKVLRNSTP